uniref:Uncharacterized protein n=2 Tax=Aegilops tauschii subsp. strangulata TaxID=200361 RepID=A0A452Y3S9_AEGTS
KCIVFEDDPRGVTAAHNCTMMAVSLIGAHPAYVAPFSLEQSCCSTQTHMFGSIGKSIDASCV